MKAKHVAAAVFVFCSLVCVLASADGAAPGAETARDAGRHFRHGVELYGEANYAGALVEFKRAYALSPNVAVLYNVGEAEFQLQDYAGALKIFRRFLADYGANESHRADVESSVAVLGSRVGLVRVTTSPAGADVTIDDDPVGTTPLQEPVLVSVGKRKVVASMAGRPPVLKYVEVAAGDDVPVLLAFAATSEATTPSPATGEERPGPEAPTIAPPGHASTRKAIGWIATGTFAAGAIVFGTLAVSEANSLAEARSELTTHAILDHRANLTTTFSILADSLATASIVVACGISLYWTLSSPRFNGHGAAAARTLGPTLSLTLGPTSAAFKTTF